MFAGPYFPAAHGVQTVPPKVARNLPPVQLEQRAAPAVAEAFPVAHAVQFFALLPPATPRERPAVHLLHGALPCFPYLPGAHRGGSVGDAVGDTVGDTVGDIVGDSVKQHEVLQFTIMKASPH